MNRYLWLPLLLIAFTVLLSGCGGGDTRPVTGSVTMDGEPLGKVIITYYPMEGGRTNSISETNDQGEYVLRYTSKAKGAIPGKYKVLISKTKKQPNGIEKELLPLRYNRKSELVAEVTSSGDNVFNFDLTSDE